MFEAILRIFRRACGINNDCLITTRPPRTITAVGLGALALWSRFASFARVPGIRHFPGLASHVSRPRHEKCEEQEFRSQLSSTSGLSVTLAGVDADLIPEQTENFSLHTPRIEWEQGCTSLNFIHDIIDIIDSVQGDEATIHDPDVYDLKHNPCSQVITPYSEDQLYSERSFGNPPQPLPPQLESGAYDIYRPYERAINLGTRLIAHHNNTAVHQVHIAYDTGVRRLHAVKSIRKSKQSCDVIEAEKAAYCMLIRAEYCPYIATLFRVLESEDLYHFIMDYYPYSLADILNASSIDVEEARLFAGQILLGMQHIHAQDIVHADIKPQNILICRDGNAVLGDFGLALMPEVASGRGPGAIGTCGTRGYMAPEMFTGQCWSFSVDFWAYGCLLYDMLSKTGVPYFLINTSTSEDIRERTLRYPLCQRNVLARVGNRFCTDLLLRLWSRDPESRPCIAGVKSHIFFHGLSWDTTSLSF